MKITIYELLGLIKDGKAPKEIEYNCERYIYDNEIQDYEKINKGEFLFDFYNASPILNDEVEIIEENRKIEKLSHKDLAITINDNANYNDKILMNKINELIEEIKKLKGKSE